VLVQSWLLAGTRQASWRGWSAEDGSCPWTVDDETDPTRDWFYQNVRLKDALVAKGYDVNYAWGMGVHSHDMGGAMLPEMMRWLWRDHPVSVDPRDTVERSFRK
jgi:hypothetical protein